MALCALSGFTVFPEWGELLASPTLCFPELSSVTVAVLDFWQDRCELWGSWEPWSRRGAGASVGTWRQLSGLSLCVGRHPRVRPRRRQERALGEEGPGSSGGQWAAVPRKGAA